MRDFEEKAALALGIALPLLEIARRRTDFHSIPFYLDDFIAGGLLLWAALASRRKLPYGRPLLCAVWGMVCGGLYSSFFGQIESRELTDISGLANQYVVIVKGVLFAIAIVAVVCSIRHFSSRTA
jgi:hypothetical protein